MTERKEKILQSYNYMRKGRRSVFSVMLAVIFLISSMPVCAVPVFADGETDAAAWDGSTADTAWYTGHESDDSYTIRTGAELAGLAKLVNDGTAFEGKTVSLAGDIDLAGDAASGKNRWTPIGQDFQHQFKGTFDGKGYTVSGLYVDSTASFSGFFGLISGRAEIKDLIISGTVKSTQMNTGGILGGTLYGTEAAVVSGCVNNCNVESVGSQAGGIAGYGWNLTIADCINNGNITYTGTAGTTGVAGVIGQMAGGADVVESCVNTGSISAASGSARLGGVIGTVAGGNEMIIRNCYNTGSVSNVGIAGGIAANAGSTGTTMKLFTSCYNRGTITGAEGQTGGIAGNTNDSVRGLLVNSYYLTGSAPSGIGGIEDGAGS